MKSSVSYDSTNFPGIRIKVEEAEGPKCPRCWNHDENIGTPGHDLHLCDRCAQVLTEQIKEVEPLVNPILTLQNLRDMYNADAGPIWVRYGVATIPAILDYYDSKLVAIWNAEGKDEGLWEDTYGVIWLAYKYRPKDD